MTPREPDEGACSRRIDRLEEVVAHLQHALDRSAEAQREMTKASLDQDRRIQALEKRIARLERGPEESAGGAGGGLRGEFDGA